jgi:hypothetical protein
MSHEKTSHVPNQEGNRSADEPKVAPSRRLAEARAYLDGVLQDLADLVYCLDDLTQPSSERVFTKASNRKAGMRHYLSAIASVRSAQRELEEIVDDVTH